MYLKIISAVFCNQWQTLSACLSLWDTLYQDTANWQNHTMMNFLLAWNIVWQVGRKFQSCLIKTRKVQIHCKKCGVIYDTLKCLPHLFWCNCHFHGVKFFTNGVVSTLYFYRVKSYSNRIITRLQNFVHCTLNLFIAGGRKVTCLWSQYTSQIA